jgi:hypothetical protein
MHMAVASLTPLACAFFFCFFFNFVFTSFSFSFLLETPAAPAPCTTSPVVVLEQVIEPVHVVLVSRGAGSSLGDGTEETMALLAGGAAGGGAWRVRMHIYSVRCKSIRHYALGAAVLLQSACTPTETREVRLRRSHSKYLRKLLGLNGDRCHSAAAHTRTVGAPPSPAAPPVGAAAAGDALG